MRIVKAVVFGLSWLCLAAPTIADEVKLGCTTQRVWVRPGIPPVMIAAFDEQKNTANFYAKEFGGIIRGSQVHIDANMITFAILTAAGEPGDVTITRSDGLLMLNVQATPDIKILADCQRQANRF